MKTLIHMSAALVLAAAVAAPASADDWSVRISLDEGGPGYYSGYGPYSSAATSGNRTSYTFGQSDGDFTASAEQSAYSQSSYSTPYGAGSYERTAFNRSSLRVGDGEVEATQAAGSTESANYSGVDGNYSYNRADVDESSWRAGNGAYETSRTRASMRTASGENAYGNYHYADASMDRASYRADGSGQTYSAEHSDAGAWGGSYNDPYAGTSTYSGSYGNHSSSTAHSPYYGGYAGYGGYSASGYYRP